ncbi:MAG: cardiolipin synthase [Propionibacteriaceae bacterium]|nr:cardiolipin synthase [Propionibacteriaceae bacterium]
MITELWLVIDIVLIVYWLAVSVLIIAENRDPTAALAWLLVLVALPGIGLVIYFFFGRNWPVIAQRSKKTRRARTIARQFMEPYYAHHDGALARIEAEHADTWIRHDANLIAKLAGAPPLTVRSCDIYPEGSEYFEVLIADLAAAERFIHLSYFIWKDDILTERITDVLVERLQAGVEVRILNDWFGSAPYSRRTMKRLRQAGAVVRFDMTGIAKLNYRNHRKITVIDAETGHTGGFNIAQEYIDGGKRFPAWRDTGLRLTGPGVAELEKLFDVRWLEVDGEDLFHERYYPDPALPAGDIVVQTVHHGFDDRWLTAGRAHQVAITGARDRVLIQSPYFVPDQPTMQAITNAAAGGVRVELMLTGMLDKKIPWYAAETYFEQLLRAGVHIYRWEKGFFHAKSLTVDGEAASIGTLNLDIRSLRLHKELMVWIYDEALARQCEEIFAADLADCVPLTLDDIRQWNWLRRFRNSAARLFSNLL